VGNVRHTQQNAGQTSSTGTTGTNYGASGQQTGSQTGQTTGSPGPVAPVQQVPAQPRTKMKLPLPSPARRRRRQRQFVRNSRRFYEGLQVATGTPLALRLTAFWSVLVLTLIMLVFRFDWFSSLLTQTSVWAQTQPWLVLVMLGFMALYMTKYKVKPWALALIFAALTVALLLFFWYALLMIVWIWFEAKDWGTRQKKKNEKKDDKEKK